jgi:hypothetical protein
VLLGLLESIGEIGVNLLQSRQLGRIDPKEWASDTRVFVLTRRPVIESAGAESDLPQLEVSEELVPFGGGELTVFLAGPLGAAAGDEGPGDARSRLRGRSPLATSDIRTLRMPTGLVATR